MQSTPDNKTQNKSHSSHQSYHHLEKKLDNFRSINYIESNNTCHASHLNSAPGQVFAFYGVFSFNLRNRKAHVIQ